MPAYAERRRTIRPRERALALGAVAFVQLVLGLALLIGLRVPLARPAEAVQRLVEITLVPPPSQRPPPVPTQAPAEDAAGAPHAQPAPPGGSPGPQPAHAPPSVTPLVAVQATVAPSGGASGAGPAAGIGAGGAGGTGYGSGGGGRELEQIAGEIVPSDYPRRLRKAGIGGRVGLLFTVGVNGRVTRCTVTQSSGVPELDVLTCRLIEQRFLFRPATDRFGRPVADEVEGEHVWDVGGRY